MSKNKTEKKKFIPYEKLSPKAKREVDKKNRGSWNGVRHYTVTHHNKQLEVSRQQERIDLQKRLAKNDF